MPRLARYRLALLVAAPLLLTACGDDAPGPRGPKRALPAAQDPDAFYRINADFHDVLYEASHTQFLAPQTISLRRRIAPYRRGVTYQPGRMRSTLTEHARIMDAIEAGDAEAAKAAAGEHVRLLGDQLSDFIASLPSGLV